MIWKFETFKEQNLECMNNIYDDDMSRPRQNLTKPKVKVDTIRCVNMFLITLISVLPLQETTLNLN